LKECSWKERVRGEGERREKREGKGSSDSVKKDRCIDALLFNSSLECRVPKWSKNGILFLPAGGVSPVVLVVAKGEGKGGGSSLVKGRE